MSSSSSCTVVDALRRHATSQPDKAAFIFASATTLTLPRRVLSRRQVWDYSRKYAARLIGMGLGKGRVVFNTLPNSPQRIITDFGTMTAGAICMTAQNAMVDGSDFIFALNRAQADAIILDPADNAAGSVFAVLSPKLQRYDPTSGEAECAEVPTLRYVLAYPLTAEDGSGGNVLLEDLDNDNDNADGNDEAEIHAGSPAVVNIAADDVCACMSTSGSTGVVKLMALSSRVLIEIGQQLAGIMDLTEDSVYMNDRNVSWLAGYPTEYFAVGSTRVMVDTRHGGRAHSPEFRWRVAFQENCSATLVPPMNLLDFSAALTKMKDTDEIYFKEMENYRMKTICCGGGTASKQQVQMALESLTQELAVFYASTETGVVTCNKVKDVDEFEEFNTGCPLSGVQIKIVDENGEEVPCGQSGDILIQSSQSTRRYINDPTNTSDTFGADGWTRLGDHGLVNDKGQLIVLGRSKFAIMKGTIILYPDLIESYIRECPGVKDVAVTAVPDDKLFQEVCACVVKETDVSLSVEDIRAFCEKRVKRMEMTDYSRLPKYYLFIDSIPVTDRGKRDRKAIKSQACEALNLKLD